jgi:hypothetical protein
MTLFKRSTQRVLRQVKVKDDVVIPVQALTGPIGSRRLRLPDLQTTGTYGSQPYAPDSSPRKHS